MKFELAAACHRPDEIRVRQLFEAGPTSVLSQHRIARRGGETGQYGDAEQDGRHQFLVLAEEDDLRPEVAGDVHHRLGIRRDDVQGAVVAELPLAGTGMIPVVWSTITRSPAPKPALDATKIVISPGATGPITLA